MSGISAAVAGCMPAPAAPSAPAASSGGAAYRGGSALKRQPLYQWIVDLHPSIRR
ncbi:MAG: hypothetical protein R2856_25160 [Caldilineaceae bacterium]